MSDLTWFASTLLASTPCSNWLTASTSHHRAPGNHRLSSASVSTRSFHGVMVGDVYQDDRGNWVVASPSHCPKGHELGPNKSLVGNSPAPAEATSPGVVDSAGAPSTALHSNQAALRCMVPLRRRGEDQASALISAHGGSRKLVPSDSGGWVCCTSR